MAGVDKDYTGEARPMPNMKVGYLPQEPELDDSKTVREVIEEAVSDVKNALADLDQVYAAYADPDADFDALAKKQAELENLITAKDGHNLDQALERAADAMRLPPWDAKVEHLSGGERRRVALCRLLLDHPDMLLLDEPTNHLDAESIAWIERFLQEYTGTVVAITHDRYFLDNAAGWILELDRGHGIPWEGNYSSWLEQKEKRLANEDRAEAERRKTLERELDWIRMSPKGRHAKSKARINAYEAMLSHESEKVAGDLEIYIPPGPRLGKVVVQAEGLCKSMGDKLLVDNAGFIIPPNAIVGIVGPNGAGKSTLFKMLVGEEQPDAGELKVGETVKFAYADQSRGSLEAGKTVYEVISEGYETVKLGSREINSRAYCSRFGLTGSDQQKNVDVLSGGERNRVHLARMLKSGANVLLLDEPTNDLDVNTMRALEDALENFAGCVLVISHDRWFLDRIATHIMAFEGDSQVVFHEGNYSDYDADRKRRLGKDAEQPHRIKFRKLTR
jgi:ATP-binding cassette ChvD family protein